MDDFMLPSPSFSMPSLGTPHPMEEDQMINPKAQVKQEQHMDQYNPFYGSGFTIQNLLCEDEIPENFLDSPPVHNDVKNSGPSEKMSILKNFRKKNVYSPVGIPTPPPTPSPMKKEETLTKLSGNAEEIREGQGKNHSASPVLTNSLGNSVSPMDIPVSVKQEHGPKNMTATPLSSRNTGQIMEGQGKNHLASPVLANSYGNSVTPMDTQVSVKQEQCAQNMTSTPLLSRNTGQMLNHTNAPLKFKTTPAPRNTMPILTKRLENGGPSREGHGTNHTTASSAQNNFYSNGMSNKNVHAPVTSLPTPYKMTKLSENGSQSREVHGMNLMPATSIQNNPYHTGMLNKNVYTSVPSAVPPNKILTKLPGNGGQTWEGQVTNNMVIPSYKCPICELDFKQESTIRRHIETTHKKNPDQFQIVKSTGMSDKNGFAPVASSPSALPISTKLPGLTTRIGQVTKHTPPTSVYNNNKTTGLPNKYMSAPVASYASAMPISAKLSGNNVPTRMGQVPNHLPSTSVHNNAKLIGNKIVYAPASGPTPIMPILTKTLGNNGQVINHTPLTSTHNNSKPNGLSHQNVYPPVSSPAPAMPILTKLSENNGQTRTGQVTNHMPLTSIHNNSKPNGLSNQNVYPPVSSPAQTMPILTKLSENNGQTRTGQVKNHMPFTSIHDNAKPNGLSNKNVYAPVSEPAPTMPILTKLSDNNGHIREGQSIDHVNATKSPHDNANLANKDTTLPTSQMQPLQQIMPTMPILTNLSENAIQMKAQQATKTKTPAYDDAKSAKPISQAESVLTKPSGNFASPLDFQISVKQEPGTKNIIANPNLSAGASNKILHTTAASQSPPNNMMTMPNLTKLSENEGQKREGQVTNQTPATSVDNNLVNSAGSLAPTSPIMHTPILTKLSGNGNSEKDPEQNKNDMATNPVSPAKSILTKSLKNTVSPIDNQVSVKQEKGTKNITAMPLLSPVSSDVDLENIPELQKIIEPTLTKLLENNTNQTKDIPVSMEQGKGKIEKVATLGLPPIELSDKPQLQNIVSTVNTKCSLDLKKIALHARNAEYNPKRFAAVIMRIREPRTTALIFDSGKMVCTGAKNEEDSRLAARKFARVVQKLGYPAKFKDFKIQNMVGSCDVKFPITLEGLFLSHNKFCFYEPELFPGLVFRMIKPKIVLLIFASGKVVLTGAKVRNDIHEAFDNILPILKNFKKQ